MVPKGRSPKLLMMGSLENCMNWSLACTLHRSLGGPHHRKGCGHVTYPESEPPEGLMLLEKVLEEATTRYGERGYLGELNLPSGQLQT